ncbi:hypothetical protein OpiT1DRAFT_05393 [Opitutaceae bacterium TAV1]|nr:hypothetical protein OPIT5_29815 [Opitutaceae bacterium TAV5]EIQ00837.1 hypothetical protein OpiT1DRAFT_05393 [Opitutaceae bacterium TAV1]
MGTTGDTFRFVCGLAFALALLAAFVLMVHAAL